MGISIASNMVASGQVRVLKKLANKLRSKLIDEGLEYLVDNNMLGVNLYLALKLINDPEELENLDDISKEYQELIRKSEFESLEEILKNQSNELAEGIDLIEEVNMYDEERYKDEIYGEEFRVLVLKKEIEGKNHIVISYNGKKLGNKKILPDEFQGLQIIYTKIATEYPDANITFTGCEGGADLSFINTLFSNQRRSYKVKAGDTVTEIGKRMFGDDWEGKLIKEDGTPYTRNDNEIYPGQKVYYDPLEADYIQIKSTLFYSNISDMKELISFTKYNMDSSYQPLITFTIKGIGENLKDTTIKAITAFITIFTAQVVINKVLSNQDLLKSIVWLYNITSYCVVTGVYASESILTTMLTGQSAMLAAGGSLLVTGAIVSLVIGLVILTLFAAKKIFDDKQLQNLYDGLAELKLIEKEENKEGIKGYITDKLLQNESVEIRTHEVIDDSKKEAQVNIETKYGILIKDKELETRLDLASNRLQSNKDSLFVKVKEPHLQFLRFTKDEDDGIYKFKSIIRTSDFFAIDQYPPKVNNLKNARDNYEDYLYEIYYGEKKSNNRVSYYEMDVETISKIKNEIKHDNNLTDEERKELTNYLRKDFTALEKLLQEYEQLISLMELFGGMQRVYKKGEETFEFIYPTKNGISLLKGIPQVNSKENFQKNVPIENLKLLNEFWFMPYLNAESGNINKKLREEYITSVVKSSLIYNNFKKSNIKSRGNYPVKETLNTLKYRQEAIEKIGHDFKGQEINQEIIRIMQELQDEDENSRRRATINKNCKISPYHYKNILEMLRNDKGLLETLYEEKKIKEVNPRVAHQFINDELDGVVKINSNNKLEYKYNPHDYIIGGELTLYALNLSQAVKERDETPFKRIPQEEFMTALEVNEMIKNNSGEIIDFEDLDIEVPKEDLYDDNIDILIEKLNNSSNINRSSKTNTEILAEEFGLK